VPTKRTHTTPPELTAEAPADWSPSQGAVEALARLLRSLAGTEQGQSAGTVAAGERKAVS
jgi:hypothetical protein